MAYKILDLMLMPYITEDMVLEEGEMLGIALHNQLSSIGEGSFEELKVNLAKRVNIQSNWQDVMYDETVASLLLKWRKERDKSWRFKRPVTVEKPNNETGVIPTDDKQMEMW